MKSMLLLVIVSLSSIGMAAPIFCGQEGNAYRVVVANDWKTAKLTVNDQEVQFGNLICQPLNHTDEAGLNCMSYNVADAGYQAIIKSNGTPTDFTAQVSEETIAGSKEVTTLPCVAAMN